MEYENGSFTMKCTSWDDPARLRDWHDLVSAVDRMGFLPLFANRINGFSVEEMTARRFWWSDEREQDPWLWRESASASGEVVYGKFFAGKSGFVSLEWFPVYANYRRDGYDFDARWDDSLATVREKKIMDRFADRPNWIGAELKNAAGFGKNGEKNFSGVLNGLQMQTYLVISGFRRKVSRRGAEYGMPVSVYTMPETVWGYEKVTSAYGESASESAQKIYAHIGTLFPSAKKEDIASVLG